MSTPVRLPLPLRERVGRGVAPGEIFAMSVGLTVSAAAFCKWRERVVWYPSPQPSPARGEGALPPVRPLRERETAHALHARAAAHTLAAAWAKVTSISVPVRPPVLIWNLARLASTSALVSDRLTPPEPA
ncbi:hypothetical protein AB7M47_002839 [Bradyrhizobium elkanii]